MGNIPDKRSAILFPAFFIALSVVQSVCFGQTSWMRGGTLPDATEAYFSIAYGNGRYVSTGQYGTIVASPDSINWFGRAADIPDMLLWSVTYGNGMFLTTGSNTILTSVDGVAWAARRVETDDYLIATTWGNGTYVAVGTRGTIFSSTNGNDWFDRSLEEGAGDFYSVCFGNGVFVAAGGKATREQQGIIYSSSDAIHWEASGALPVSLWSVTFGNGLFTAAGDGGTVLTSSDGVEWTGQKTGNANRLMSVVYGNNRFVAVGAGGTILTSPDGNTWAVIVSGTGKNLYSVAFGNNQFVAIGDGGTVLVASVENTFAQVNGSRSVAVNRQITFTVGAMRVRCPVPAGFTGNTLDAGLFTVAGKKLYSTRLELTENGVNAPAFYCAPGTYLVVVSGGGMLVSMPVTVAR